MSRYVLEGFGVGTVANKEGLSPLETLKQSRYLLQTIIEGFMASSVFLDNLHPFPLIGSSV